MIKISSTLAKWYNLNHRQLPWRETNDPYKIWLSEIILQQTQVSQGLKYYVNFTETFPTVFDLAAASLDEVLKLWQGLGYYSRARNLHETSNIIANTYNGIFPSTYKEILKLKGIGPYTAAAISSFAFHEHHAVVDGNVFRFLSRYFGILTPIDTSSGQKEFASLAYQLLPKTKSDLHNQAIMEFGALQCTPKKPNCEECPFQNPCDAYNTNTIDILPVKGKKLKKRDRFLTFLHFQQNNHRYISQRLKKDIWQNLYQLPIIESSKKLNLIDIIKDHLCTYFSNTDFIIKSETTRKHQLSHQTLYAHFITIQISPDAILLNYDLEKSEISALNNYAFPTLINNFLQETEAEYQP